MLHERKDGIMSAEIHYQRLNADNFTGHSLDDFVRHQSVGERQTTTGIGICKTVRGSGMYIVKAEAEQVENIVNMYVRAFETDVNVGGIKGECPPEYNSIEWHKQMAREGHLYQAMIGNDLVGAAIVFPDETEKSVCIGRIFIDSVYHGKGYGIRLMDCIEKNFPDAAEFNLDTPCWNERTTDRKG